MPDPTASLVARVKAITGSRINVDPMDLVVLAKINTTDDDQVIAVKLSRFTDKYPGTTQTPDKFLDGLRTNSKRRNTRGIGRLWGHTTR